MKKFIAFFLFFSILGVFTFMITVTSIGIHERYNDYLNTTNGKVEKMPSSLYHKYKIPAYKTIGAHWEWNW